MKLLRNTVLLGNNLLISLSSKHLITKKNTQISQKNILEVSSPSPSIFLSAAILNFLTLTKFARTLKTSIGAYFVTNTLKCNIKPLVARVGHGITDFYPKVQY